MESGLGFFESNRLHYSLLARDGEGPPRECQVRSMARAWTQLAIVRAWPGPHEIYSSVTIPNPDEVILMDCGAASSA